MAERIREEDQKRIVQNKNREEEIREVCFRIEYLMLKIFMFAVSNFTGNFGNCYLGSIYYYDISKRRPFGSLDVYEIQTGDEKVILPGVFSDEDTTSAIANDRVPTDFHSFPNRTDYIDIHSFRANFREVFHREYHNSEDGDRNENDVESNSTEEHNFRYSRMPMHEITNIIHSRHDPCTPSMKNIEQRMRTFYGWQMTGEWTAENVAQAGFFYKGNGNQAECYHCGFCAYEWDEAPIILHVRWVPGCRFLRDTFSQDFIYNILFNRE